MGQDYISGKQLILFLVAVVIALWIGFSLSEPPKPERPKPEPPEYRIDDSATYAYEDRIDCPESSLGWLFEYEKRPDAILDKGIGVDLLTDIPDDIYDSVHILIREGDLEGEKYWVQYLHLRKAEE